MADFGHLFQKGAPLHQREPLWLIDIRDEAPWSEDSPVLISIGAKKGGDDAKSETGEIRLGRQWLDTDDIPDLAVNTMRDVITGKLSPGETRLI